MKKLFLSPLLVACIFTTGLLAKEYTLDKVHTNVGFKIKHLQISNVRGDFKEYDAVIDYDPATSTFKKLEANIRVSSINTENQTRDDDLQTDAFFKASQYPELTFVMKEYQKIDDEKGKLSGVLTLAGVSKDIVLDVEIGGLANFQGREKLGFSLSGKIKRSDFNFAPDTSALILSDDVDLNIEVETYAK